MNQRFLIVASALEKAFGEDLNIYLYKPDLPYVYFSNFEIYKVKTVVPFILANPVSEDVPNELIGGLVNIFKQLDKKIVIFIDTKNKERMDYLFENNIKYLLSNGETNLFVNEYLNDYIGSNEPGIVYSKTTQMLVNFYLSNPIKEYSVRHIAELLDFSYSSVSRANRFLYQIGALIKQGFSNVDGYILKSKKELLDRVKPYLINPIRSSYTFIANQRVLNKVFYLKSGEDALAHYTNLEKMTYRNEIAVDSSDLQLLFNALKENMNFIGSENKFYVFHEFIYPIKRFQNNGYISLFDTYIIALKKYQKSNDPRIVAALKQMERELTHE